jgi:hypothetical protein
VVQQQVQQLVVTVVQQLVATADLYSQVQLTSQNKILI